MSGDRIEGEDPLAVFGPNATDHLRRTDSFTNAPDILVNSFYDPQADEGAAFEELIGFHGGMDGNQTHPFLLFPAGFDLSDVPIVGAATVHHLFKGWIAALHDGTARALVSARHAARFVDPRRELKSHRGDLGRSCNGTIRGRRLSSHVHLDHLPSLRRLRPSARVLAPRGSGRLLRKAGFTAVTEIAVGEHIDLGPVVIDVVPAVHAPGRGPHARVRTDPVGFVVNGAGRRIYFPGDTDLFDEMADLGDIDVALLPIWGWGSTLGEGT